MAYKEKHAAGFDRITVADVLKKLFEVWKPNATTETIPMERSVGRILAADVRSVNTLPVVRSSGRDGYAVRSADFANGHPDTSAWTLGADYIRADTGDDFDDAFDAVVKVENAHFDENNHFRVNDGIEVKSGLDVNGRGSQIKEGDLILAKGFPIRGYDLGSFAQGGVTEVTVVSKPKVIFIPTGNELIPAGQKPERGQNIDSNSVLVKQMLTELGADVKCTPIISDNVVDLETSLDAAVKDADIVILNGGTSKGLDDHNAEILEN
ncbi:MAG: molybdopterin molybdenumtransferase MoeA, partial [Oscillospiraceae bacterium]|nr:molybdopterin molybdenumtransferase MoeA [Oscillospiraceae bacterium]